MCYSPIPAKQAHFLLTHGQLQTIPLFFCLFYFIRLNSALIQSHFWVFVTLPELYFTDVFVMTFQKRKSLWAQGRNWHCKNVNKKILLKWQNYRIIWKSFIKWDKTRKQIARSSGKKQHFKDKYTTTPLGFKSFLVCVHVHVVKPQRKTSIHLVKSLVCCLHNHKTVQFQTGSQPQKKNNSKATPAFTADPLKNSLAEDQQLLETVRLGDHASNRLFLLLTHRLERQGLCFCHKLAMTT